mmetsp:Transcript_40014/g.125970  ORF Transcript_40014/g.125970 Transcript_40014/m.125970 type:complete len:1170 (-) Transcript_40014:79-3588(-)
MPLKQADRKMSARQVRDFEEWCRFMPEFENVYMGQRPDGKRVQWYVPDVSALADYPSLDFASGLEAVNEQLSNLATSVCNVSPYLGFTGVCRSNAMVHMNCITSDEELDLLDKARSNAVGAGVLQSHLAFYHRRKVCMLYFVNGSGGTLTLHPASRLDESITLTCQEGQVVIFRHDIMDYTFLPEGNQITMQAWVFREEQAGECSMAQPELLNYSDVIEAIPRGPIYGNNGKSIDAMSMGTRLPGLMMDPESYWCSLSVGLDGVIRIPNTRWDHDVYYEPDPETAALMGKAYLQHEAMLDTDQQMMMFDNEFFGIARESAMKMDPNARNVIEVGYDALHRAGWTKSKLHQVSMTIVYGMAAGEFESNQMNQWTMPIAEDTRSEITLGAVAGRLHYLLGMTGRCATIETACSSSLTAIALMHTHMRPDQAGQQKLSSRQEKYGMGMGANGHFNPFFKVGLCGAKMLSNMGRCFTFDSSGDGFVQGEGMAGLHFKLSEGEDLARLAMLCGTCMNQDGRSASMTAPHGPSQQECIRHSLREANVPALKIQIQELHGTGTALGDPIEVGALRATMMMIDGVIREHPLVKTSSKSNIGHTELTAGLCGIIKCVMMGIYCNACPNNHIRLLNPHIDSQAYPVYFVTEEVDQGKNEGYMGVSSFGFGGSNARGDIWSRALCGPRSTDPHSGYARIFTPDRIFIWSEISKQALPQPGFKSREEGALDNLKDYEDAYMVGEQPTEDDSLYVIGSFNGWSMPEKMEFIEETGCYIFALPLGEACVEQFQICMNKNEYFKIFPASKMANEEAIILGPGVAPQGNHWVIDGRPKKKPQGTVYQITLQWDVESRKKTISWEASKDDYMMSLAGELQPFRHRYHIVSSWSNWKPVEMQQVKGEKPGTLETTVRVGIMRHEEFRIQRDKDKFQSIYPARQRASESDDANVVWQWTQAGVASIRERGDLEKYGNPQVGSTFTSAHLAIAVKSDSSYTTDGLAAMGLITSGGAQSVPICGPDHYGEGKYWMMSGFMGEEIKILLRIWEGEIEVSTVNSRIGTRTWTNQQAALRRKYFVSGTWNDFGFTQMEADPNAEGATVHYLTVTMESTRMVMFHIVMDEDRAQTIHPDMNLTDQLLSPAVGPDAKGEGHFWGMYVEKGTTIEIKLDLSQDDRRKVVTWTPASR